MHRFPSFVHDSWGYDTQGAIHTPLAVFVCQAIQPSTFGPCPSSWRANALAPLLVTGAFGHEIFFRLGEAEALARYEGVSVLWRN
jgi:hypothetical protein